MQNLKMEDLIEIINTFTSYRIEIIYHVDWEKEGYKARFFADEYEMEEVFSDPKEALVHLIRNYNTIITK